MNSIIHYIRLRLKPLPLLSLTAFITVFSIGAMPLFPEDTGSILLLLFFLVVMRVYDDFCSMENDRDKSERSYTNPLYRREMTVFLSLVVSGFALVASSINSTFFVVCAAYFVLNHILYFFLYARGKWKFYLPLLKYPLAAVLLLLLRDTQLTFPSFLPFLALFTGFVIFEYLDDAHFDLSLAARLFWTALTFGLLLNGEYVYISSIAGFIFSLPLLYYRFRGAPYLFLIILLLTRLAIETYGI